MAYFKPRFLEASKKVDVAETCIIKFAEHFPSKGKQVKYVHESVKMLLGVNNVAPGVTGFRMIVKSEAHKFEGGEVVTENNEVYGASFRPRPICTPASVVAGLVPQL